MPDVRNDAKWVPGLEVGGEYTYLARTEAGELQAVRLCVLAIHEPTCTVSILGTEILDEAGMDRDQKAIIDRMEATVKSGERVVRWRDIDPESVQ